MDKLNFQYCQKIVVLSKDKQNILLCKRKGEADFNGRYSFIGGKMETTDKKIIDGLKREKDEEVGEDFKIKVYLTFSFNINFVKKDGSAQILSHYLAIHQEGDIILNDEYSDYKWISINKLNGFEPKILNIYDITQEILRLDKISRENEFILI